VQGDGAAAQVAAAIAGFNAIVPGGVVPRPDLLIVARGGGSLEDLMPFNEEIVVRAAAASVIPLISAVGHETDTTLIDFASDRRAPTPSAAAEMAVPVRLDLRAEMAAKAGRLSGGLARFFADRRMRLQGLARGLPEPLALIGAKAQLLDDRVERLGFAFTSRLRSWRGEIATLAARLRHPQLQIDEKRRRLADYRPRLDGAARRLLHQRHERLDALASRLASHTLSHRNVLARGYAVVLDARRHAVMSVGEVGENTPLTIGFHDGEVAVTSGGRSRAAKPAAPKPQQPKLL
jgi:exodeoxyribonuclease VII large subunit